MLRITYRRTLVVIIIALVTIGLTSLYYWNYTPRIPVAVLRYTETIKVENNGIGSLEFGGVTLNAFLTFKWQKPRIIYINYDYQIVHDKDGNPVLKINGPLELEPNQTYSATVVYVIESYLRQVPKVTIEESDRLSDIPASLINEYTREVPPWWSPPDARLNTTYWIGSKYYNMTLHEIAEELKGDSDNILEIIFKDVEWITSHIHYYSDDPTYPIETARNGRGDCDDQSNLLISLLRIQGIPAFLMMGQIYLIENQFATVKGTAMDGHLFYEAHHTIGHAWAMVYVPPWGWIPCDPVVATPEKPESSVTQAYALSPMTVVFKNLTGVNETPDYIGYFRNETETMKTRDVYFWLTQEMEQLPIPIHVVLLQSKTFMLFTEVTSFTAITIMVYIYDSRRERIRERRGIYCIYCGAKNPVDAVYCGLCGQRMKKH